MKLLICQNWFENFLLKWDVLISDGYSAINTSLYCHNKVTEVMINFYYMDYLNFSVYAAMNFTSPVLTRGCTRRGRVRCVN